jgi:hypothetical protein
MSSRPDRVGSVGIARGHTGLLPFFVKIFPKKLQANNRASASLVSYQRFVFDEVEGFDNRKKETAVVFISP